MLTTAIRQLADQIAKAYYPERVILFGSYAKGIARPDSDVDLLVILNHDKRNVHKAIEILERFDPKFDVDLLVRKPRDIEERLKMKDFFMSDILKEGVVLYDSSTK